MTTANQSDLPLNLIKVRQDPIVLSFTEHKDEHGDQYFIGDSGHGDKGVKVKIQKEYRGWVSNLINRSHHVYPQYFDYLNGKSSADMKDLLNACIKDFRYKLEDFTSDRLIDLYEAGFANVGTNPTERNDYVLAFFNYRYRNDGIKTTLDNVKLIAFWGLAEKWLYAVDYFDTDAKKITRYALLNGEGDIEILADNVIDYQVIQLRVMKSFCIAKIEYQKKQLIDLFMPKLQNKVLVPNSSYLELPQKFLVIGVDVKKRLIEAVRIDEQGNQIGKPHFYVANTEKKPGQNILFLQEYARLDNLSKKLSFGSRTDGEQLIQSTGIAIDLSEYGVKTINIDY